jgi:hypothetical protein
MVADCGLLAGLYGLGFFLFLPYYEQQLREDAMKQYDSTQYIRRLQMEINKQEGRW